MVIQVDSREKPKAIKKILKEFDEQGVKWFVSKVYAGDYVSLDNPRLVIDRKQNLAEICSNIGSTNANHERFKRELIRANELGIEVIVLIEHGEGITCLEDVQFWENPRIKESPLATDGPKLFKIMRTMEKRYNVKFMFCEKMRQAREFWSYLIMTSEEIKKNIEMPDLMRSYGINVRGNMCKCPFHDDSSPSMKVFKDGCHCFTCGKNWDVFAFVQEIERCDFKTAYRKLGGGYDQFQNRTNRVLAERQYRLRKEKKEKEERDKKELLNMIIKSIWICEAVIEMFEPLSDEWTDAQNTLSVMDCYYSALQIGKEIDRQGVIRRYRELNSKYIIV